MMHQSVDHTNLANQNQRMYDLAELQKKHDMLAQNTFDSERPNLNYQGNMMFAT